LTPEAVAYSRTWRVRTTAARRAIVVYEFALDGQNCTPDTRIALWRVTADYLRLSACAPLMNP